MAAAMDHQASTSSVVLSVCDLEENRSKETRNRIENAQPDKQILPNLEPQTYQKCQQIEGPESLTSNSSSSSNSSVKICDQTDGCCSADLTNIPSEMTNLTKPSVNNNNAREDTSSLEGALASLQEKLILKDKEIHRLSRIREDLEAEMEDLTASLFEEAHKMVREANVKQVSSEKALAEATMKIDGLETEVAALKTMVLTSTPSQPNKHLHPQLNCGKKGSSKNIKGHNRGSSSESVSSLGSGKALASNSVASNAIPAALEGHGKDEDHETTANRYFDPTLRKDYLQWKKEPTVDPHHPFVGRIYKEDIDPCLNFPNEQLSQDVREAIHSNDLCLSPIKDFSDLPRNCALLDAPVLCKYSLRLTGVLKSSENDANEPMKNFYISQLARNRLAAVCDCLNYLRYVEKGLVKAPVNDVYWEIMRLRKNIVTARLGFCDEHC